MLLWPSRRRFGGSFMLAREAISHKKPILSNAERDKGGGEAVWQGGRRLEMLLQKATRGL